jgi:hypothetical protein
VHALHSLVGIRQPRRQCAIFLLQRTHGHIGALPLAQHFIQLTCLFA